MEFLHYISGPLIGAVIGYCTNYIAVKMLFRPYKEIKIGRFTLPFTPGIIPKRKNDLAAAVGKAVGNTLLTEEDMESMLLSRDMEYSITELCMAQLDKVMESAQTLGEMIPDFMGEESYEKSREKLTKAISDKIMFAIEEMEPGKLIAQEGKKAVQQKLEGSMFSMFLTDKLLDSLSGEIGAYAENYIKENAPVYIREKVEEEVADLERASIAQVRGWIPMDRDTIQKKVGKIYRECIGKFAGTVVKQFHIAEMVEKKIREMDVKELEDLVMSVMKHELGMIVNLGALIGFVIGLLNLCL